MVRESSKTLRGIVNDSELELALEFSRDSFAAGQFLAHLDNFISGTRIFYPLRGLLSYEWVEEAIKQVRGSDSTLSDNDAIGRFGIGLVLDNYLVSETAETIARSVAGYFVAIVDKYLEPDFKLLFSKALEAAAFLPEDYRVKPLDQLTGLVRVDEQSNNESSKGYFVPRILKEIMLPLLEEHKKELAKWDHKMNKTQYDKALEGLSSDLDKLATYTREKLELNKNWDPKADEISYAECFPEKMDGGDRGYEGLTPDYLMALLRGGDPNEDRPRLTPLEAAKQVSENGGYGEAERLAARLEPAIVAAQTVLHYFGNPFRMQQHGKPSEEGIKIACSFGDHGNHHRVQLVFTAGLDQKEKRFIFHLLDHTVPIAGDDSGQTTKLRNYLLTH